MSKRKAGQRHHLLLFERVWNRLWKNTWPFGALLAIFWLIKDWIGFPVAPLYDALIFLAASLILVFSLATFLARKLAYIQAYADHIRLVTPLFRMNISYRRVRGVHTASLEQLYPPKTTKGPDRRLLEPFYGSTVLLLEMKDYPISLRTLHFFFPRPMFSPKSTAFVVIVKDWMKLATEIDSMRGSWRQEKSQPSLSVYGQIYGGKKK
ncbi:MAG: hypothetical protein JW726_06920 [Anaerolineales bacterium]|nr:hypothetical protein [Anaerolineales bacterium]